MRGYCISIIAFMALCAGADAVELPDPPACAGFQSNEAGSDADCDGSIAKETDPAVKSVLLYRRAYMITDRGDFNTYPKALTDLNEAIRLLPTNYLALHERAYIYNEYGRWSDALKDMDAQIALHPQVSDGYQERAMSRLNLGDLQGHYEDRNAVVMLRPRVAGPLLGRAEAALWLGRFDDARKDIETAEAIPTKTERDSEEIPKLRSEIALLTNTSGAAGACANADKSGNLQSKTLIGDCTRAFLVATTAKAKADALTIRAIGWLNSGNEEDARGDYAIAAALNPDDPTTHSNLGFAYMRDRHSTAATEQFDLSIALKPTATAYAGRARAKLNLHDVDGAFLDAKKSFEIEPNILGVMVLGDTLYARTKSYDEAKKHWIAAYRMGDRSDGLISRLTRAGVPIPPPEGP